MSTLRSSTVGVQIAKVEHNLRSTGVYVQIATAPAGTLIRASTVGTQIAVVSNVPGTPLISGTAILGGVMLGSSPFVPPGTALDDEHFQTDWRYEKASNPGVWTTITREAPSPELLGISILGLDNEPYNFQVRHVGLVSGAGAFSASITLDPADGIPKPHKPSVSITHIDLTDIEALGSAFSHDEPTTTKEEYDPLNPRPYLDLIEVEVLDDAGIVIYQEILATFSLPPTFFIDGLTQATAYDGIRIRYFEGHYKAWSDKSDLVPFMTASPPASAPGTPTLSLVSCGGGARGNEASLEVTSAYSHPFGVPLRRHRWRARWSTLTSPRAFHFTNASQNTLIWPLPEGSWLLAVAWEDEDGHTGAYSNEVACTVVAPPRQVVILTPAGTVVTDSHVDFSWKMWDGLTAYTFVVEVSDDEGLSYAVAQNSSATTWIFDAVVRGTGIYYVRIAAISPAGIKGEYAYVVVVVDKRVGTPGVDKTAVIDFRQHTALLPTWIKKLNTGVSWALKSDPEAQPGDPPSVGLLAVVNDLYNQRLGGLAFTEFDMLDEVEILCEFALLGEHRSWYPWRHSNIPFLRAGLGWKMEGTHAGGDGNGFVFSVVPGANPWYIKAKPCVGFHSNCGPPNCGGLNCTQCRQGGPVHASTQLNHPTLKNSVLSYGTAITNATLRSGRITNNTYGQQVTASLPHGSGKLRGMQVTDTGEDWDPICRDYSWYIMRAKLFPEGSGYRVKAQVQGPGIQPSSYQLERVIQGGTIPPDGFVGLFVDYTQSGLNPNKGILFKTFALIVPPAEASLPFEEQLALGTSLIFDVGRYKREGGYLSWHQHSRVITRPATVEGNKVTYVGESNQVLQINEDTLVANGYFVSPSLNRENRLSEKTLTRVILRYTCAAATNLIIDGSGDGGVTWIAGFTPTAVVEATAGSTEGRRVIQGMNVTGYDVKFRVRWPSDQKVTILEWRAEGVVRGDMGHE